MTSHDDTTHLPDDAHLRQDINVPEQALVENEEPALQLGAPGPTNAGQHAAGVTPAAEVTGTAGATEAGGPADGARPEES